jgi:hypothetical protein
MSDNVPITAGVGTQVSTDELTINAVLAHVQRMKLVAGKDGTYVADLSGRIAEANEGVLYVDPRQLTIGIQVASAGLTTAATAYTSGDQLGTILTFANANRSAGLSGTIQSAVLVDKAKILGAVDLYLFDRSVTLAADNAAADFSDADALFCLGILRFPAPITTASNGISTIEYSGLAIRPNVTSLFGALVTRTGHTFFGAVSDIVVTLQIVQD